MKKFVLTIFLMLVFTLGFSQVTNYNITFEPSTPQGTWNYFENGTNTTGVTFLANPFPGGVNSSATVAKFTAVASSAGGKEYSGCESLYGTLGKWKFDGAAPTTVTMDVYKSTLAPIVIKFTSTNSAGQGTVFIGTATPSAINQWVTLTYIVDFSTSLIGATGYGTGGGGIENADNNFGTNQFVMHADKIATRTADQDIYFDNIKFTATKLAEAILPPATIDAPTVHAPVPPNRNTSDVVSIYSSQVYTDLLGTKIGKNWGEATIASDITVDGDLTKFLKWFNFQGVVLPNPINLSGFEKIHIDFWQTDQTQIKLSIINVGGGDVTKLLTIGNPGWNSYDIPLSDFVGLNLSTVHQLKLTGAPKQGTTTVYFDNLYFYKGTALGTQSFKTANISIYPNPVKNNLNIEAKSTIKKVFIYNLLGQEVLAKNLNSNSTTLQTNNLAKGVYVVKASIDGKEATSKFIKE